MTIKKSDFMLPRIPKRSEFATGTTFHIKEFDVPLANVLENGESIWINWYGGKPRNYDVKNLKVGNNWVADTYEDWVELIVDSINDVL